MDSPAGAWLGQNDQSASQHYVQGLLKESGTLYSICNFDDGMNQFMSSEYLTVM